jgi:5-formyltetrahydrofolate cyclo-ligase
LAEAPDDMSETAAEKRRLRPLLRDRRASIDVASRDAAARALADVLFAAAPWSSADDVVAGYWPIGAEIDVRPLLATLCASGRRCALPVIDGPGRPLLFRGWTPGDRLVSAGFGTSVPADDSPVLVPSVLLVPLLAFDSRGFRLGYGGGYYDRTIAGFRRAGLPARAIGVAFARQEIERVPVEEFDQRLDGVATEDGLRRFGGAP